MSKVAIGALALAAEIAAQAPGSLKTENHPSLTSYSCTKSGGCTAESTLVTVDSNWRWMHETAEAVNCYTGNLWNTSLCPDEATCTSNCVIEGADEEYSATYGIRASDAALELTFVTAGEYSRNVGSRTYLMEDENTYKMFKLKNKEFTFDVDVSKLPCGLNGALYFVQMDADGGMAKYENNTAGAKYGTGYCDAQCPHDLKWINGAPNVVDWLPSATDPNSGTGHYGTCCVEMDIWEANAISTAYTAHSCAAENQTRCEGVDCGDNASGDRFNGLCDKNGCDMQTYRLNNYTFYGNGSSFQLDSSKPMTVVTQFITDDGTDTGTLIEIKRKYVQGNKTIWTPSLPVGGYGSYDKLSEGYCTAEKTYFADGTNFLDKGGFGSMDDAFTKGVVLVMSIWDDHDVNMLWLDSTYPVNGTSPGDKRGTCASSSGVPAAIEASAAGSKVTYSNIKLGEINSTTGSSPPSPSPTPSGCTNAAQAQCGGSAWTGATCCPDGYTCTVQNPYYSQCLPSSRAEVAATPTVAKKWGTCSASLPCPTGWECGKRAEAAQCVPTKALSDAFARTKPSKQAMADFLKTGKTVFGRDGQGQ